MEPEILSRRKEADTMIIISLGGRDAVIDMATQQTYTSYREFEENIRKLIDIARKYTGNIVFIGPVGPRDESKTNPIAWMPGHAASNKVIREFNSIEKRVCKEKGVDFIDVFSKLEKLDYKSLLEDGIHPNTKGHKKLFSIIRSYLMRNELIKRKRTD